MSSSHRTTVTIPSDEMLAAIEKRAKANGLKLGTYFLHLAAADCGRHGEWPVPPADGSLLEKRPEMPRTVEYEHIAGNTGVVHRVAPNVRIEIHQPNGDIIKMEAHEAEARHTGHDWQLVATLAVPPGVSPWSPDSATTPADPE